VYNTYQKTISEDAGTGPNASTVVAYFFQDEDAGYHHYQGTSGDFPRAFVIGTAYLLRIVTNLHPPRLLMARWLFEQPHRRQSSRRIHLFRRNRKRDRGGLVCISGIVE